MKTGRLSLGWSMVVLSVACVLVGTLSGIAATDELPALIEQIKQTPFTGDAGIDKRGQEIAGKVAKFGPRAIPLLLPLLKSGNQNVRDLAGYTLRDIPEGLTEKDLDILIEADRSRDTWLPSSIARIGTPRAIRYLAQALRRVKSTGNQYDGAFECGLREKGVPYLVELYREGTFDRRLTDTLNSVFEALRDRAESAVDPLMGIAADEKLPLENRQAAVEALGAIGPKARRALPFMRELAKKQPSDFKESMKRALTKMGAPESVEVFVDRLKAEPGWGTRIICDIARLRENGVSAGPELLLYLKSEDWEMRVAAARAMGYIGYQSAVPDLIKLLDSSDDWRVVWASAESLGRLHVKAALPALERVAKTHWYPYVRKAAVQACEAIKGRAQYVALDRRYGHFDLEFAQYNDYRYWEKNQVTREVAELLIKRCDSTKEAAAGLDAFKKVWFKDYYYDGKGIRKRPQNQDVIPEAWLKVEDGFLVGWSDGREETELRFLGVDSSIQSISGHDVSGLYRMKNGSVAVTRQVHFTGFCAGKILKVRREKSGKWTAINWRSLPGAPIESALLKNGNLFVICWRGVVIISPEGKMEWVKLKVQPE